MPKVISALISQNEYKIWTGLTERVGYMINLDKSDAPLTAFSLLLAFSHTSRMTCATLSILLKEDLEPFRRRLQELKSLAWHPLLLPLILVEQEIESKIAWIRKVRFSLYNVEKTSGTHKNYHEFKRHAELGYTAIGAEAWNRKDFDFAAGDLTSLASDCLLFISQCETKLELLC